MFLLTTKFYKDKKKRVLEKLLKEEQGIKFSKLQRDLTPQFYITCHYLLKMFMEVCPVD